jgi:methyl-accepting chemotaxis protein
MALLTTFRARAIGLTEDALRSDLSVVLDYASSFISGDDALAMSASDEDSPVFEQVRSTLVAAAELPPRSDVIAFVALPAENGGLNTLVSTSPERIAGVWDSAETIMADAVQIALSGEQAIHVQQFYLGEDNVWTSGFTPLTDSAGEVVGIIGADISANWVFDVRNEVIKITAFVFLIIYPVIIATIFYISGKLTRPLKQMIAAAETVEKGEPFNPESIANIQEYSDELGLMARVFTRMAVEVQAREAALKQQVKSLEIQIDQAKRNKQVEEITESDFFKDLQRKKEQLRASTGAKKSESN